MEKSRSYLLEDKEKAKEESLRLKAQAKMLFQLELRALQEVGIGTPCCLLDIGCGNGSYLELLLEAFPHCQGYGVDRNITLLEDLGNAEKIQTYNFDITNEEKLKALILESNSDTLISRYVFQHLSSTGMNQILKSVAGIRNSFRRLILIDTDDREIRFEPQSDALKTLCELKGKKQRALGGNRAIGAELITLLSAHNFTEIMQKKLVFSNLNLGLEAWLAIFWPVILSGVAENSTRKDQELICEAFDWFEQAKKNQNYTAAWTVYYVSGR